MAINFSNHSLSGEKFPLVFGAEVAAHYAPVAEARYHTITQLNAGANAPHFSQGEELINVGDHFAATATLDHWTRRRWPARSWCA